MNEKKVTINGHELSVVFNMAVEIEYEDISGQPFDIPSMTTQKATMQLCYASLKVANGKLPFTFDELKKSISVEEWLALKDTVIAIMTEWFHIPAVMKEENQNEEEAEKNS